ncbi:hypothetical protein MPDQ_004558 [Monascus purpureus]|uniref:Uncharacterized protein n=1 Tax=Monascus purpureus TaxID=5098 RepID=A0A507R6Z4_MONPU|nr:hypothetical protein MPDQ_004558 [Monascus purpureus]
MAKSGALNQLRLIAAEPDFYLSKLRLLEELMRSGSSGSGGSNEKIARRRDVYLQIPRSSIENYGRTLQDGNTPGASAPTTAAAAASHDDGGAGAQLIESTALFWNLLETSQVGLQSFVTEAFIAE